MEGSLFTNISHAHTGESLALGAQSIASGLLGATLSSLPGIGIGSGNSGAATTTSTAPAAATAGNGTAASTADSRFIMYLTQALEARRAAARAAAEEEELLRRQLPEAMHEARSYVLNVYEPPEVDDG